MSVKLVERLLSVFFVLLLLFSSIPSVNAAEHSDRDTYGPVTVADATASGTWGDLSSGQGRNSRISPRAVELNHQSGEYAKYNGYIFVTMEYGVTDSVYAKNETVFPMYVSTDGGHTWARNVADGDNFPDIVNQNLDGTPNVECMANCPQFFELPAPLGKYPAGTVICGGIASKKDLSTSSLDVYMSTDACHSWTYTSTVAAGGPNFVGDDPVWEPFFLYDDGDHDGAENDHAPVLICFYSDETDASHSQKLVCKYTEDGENWSEAVEVVAFEETAQRPGMPVVAKMQNGKYIMVYEGYGMIDLPNNYKFSTSDCALDWDADEVGMTFGYGGSPYVEVMSDGTIVLSSAGNSNLYVNSSVDGTGRWAEISSPVPNSYNRQIMRLADGRLFILNGGWHGGDNAVICGTVNVSRDAVFNTDAVYLISSESGNAVCTWADSLEDGSTIAQWAKISAAHFYWQLVPVSVEDCVYKIINPASGLAVTADASGNGAKIHLKKDENDPRQLWHVESVGDGYSITLDGTQLALCGKASPVGWDIADFGLYLEKIDPASKKGLWRTESVDDNEKVSVSVEVSGGECDVSAETMTVYSGTDGYFCLNPHDGYVISDIALKSGNAILRKDSDNARHFGVRNVTSDTVIAVTLKHVNSDESKDAILIGSESGDTYICMTQNTSSNGAALIEWGLETGLGFRWIPEIVDADKNIYRFLSLNGGNALAANDGGEVFQSSPSRSDQKQQWILQRDEKSGLYTFRNVATGLYMTRSGYSGGQNTYPSTAKKSSSLKGQLWSIDCLIIFDANGGRCTTEYMAVRKGDAMHSLPKASLKGSTFGGWFTDVSEGTKLTSEDIVDCSYTLYARWNVSEPDEPYTETTDGTDCTADTEPLSTDHSETDGNEDGCGSSASMPMSVFAVFAAVFVFMKKRKT